MPQPSAGDLHVDYLLTDLSVAFLQSANNFVADRVFPRVPVQLQSNKYAIYSRADFMRDEMQLRGPGSAAARSGYSVSNDSYSCLVYALGKDVDDQTVANADAIFSPMRDATEWLTQKEMLKREVDFTSNFFTTGKWTGSSTGTDLVAGTDFTAWDNVASTPIEDIHKQVAYIESQTGFQPNTLVLNRTGWFALKNHPDIVDRVKYTSDQPISEAIVARYFGLDQILVTGAAQNTAQEGLTGSYGYIAGKHALLCYSAPAPSTQRPSAGYTFVWNGYVGSAEGRRIKSYRWEETASQRIEIEATWDMKIVSAVLGAFFQNVAS